MNSHLIGPDHHFSAAHYSIHAEASRFSPSTELPYIHSPLFLLTPASRKIATPYLTGVEHPLLPSFQGARLSLAKFTSPSPLGKLTAAIHNHGQQLFKTHYSML